MFILNGNLVTPIEDTPICILCSERCLVDVESVERVQRQVRKGLPAPFEVVQQPSADQQRSAVPRGCFPEGAVHRPLPWSVIYASKTSNVVQIPFNGNCSKCCNNCTIDHIPVYIYIIYNIIYIYYIYIYKTVHHCSDDSGR